MLLSFVTLDKLKFLFHEANKLLHICPVLQACNPKYEDFDKTGSICASENINNTLTQYRWLVSAPTGPDGVTSPMKEVDFDTFFTSSKMITLDSIYFQAGSRVQCAARAVNSDGNEGLELMSSIVTISTSEGKISSPIAKSLVHFWIPNSILTKSNCMIGVLTLQPHFFFCCS